MDSDHSVNTAPDVLKQDFAARLITQGWVGDIAHVWMREGGNLAVIPDLHSTRVIGWATGNRVKQDMANALHR